ncbi:hypothetical protein LTR62_005907 [Meristemomyces frigidus]|uniref:Peptidase A1 domain-containing protein n=1 Tax=Meristemomyces frigidus TaxID=1508187 RepID=A0AAN7YJ72_9PEZI|nr:hypothetical protein LTR62_005907 [Meristemomyces frigidus]
MHQPATITLLAVLASCALAAPTPAVALAKRSFKVPVAPRIGLYRSPRQEIQRTYAKFGWEIITFDPSVLEGLLGGGDSAPSSGGDGGSASSSSAAAVASSSATTTATSPVMPAASATADYQGAAAPATTVASGAVGEVTATPESNESEYLEPVTIGGQTLNLDFDTGSSDLWVFSSSLSASESSGHTTYDPSTSSSFSEYQGGSWSISYGDGSSASGTVGFDKVNIGGATVNKQCVELAERISGSFVSDTNNDGLVGLAFSSINTVKPQKQSTFFENVLDSLAQPVFTANLEDNSSGTYTFGEIDSTQYSGDIHFTPIDKSQGFWQFDSSTYSVGGKTQQCTTCSPAIADTGTSLILVDDDVAQNYYAQVPSAKMDQQQGGYVYDCAAQLPTFGIAIGDYIATLTGQQVTFANLGDGTCFGGVQGNQGQGLQIYGDMLLKNFFAVFDAGNESFGIATKA